MSRSVLTRCGHPGNGRAAAAQAIAGMIRTGLALRWGAVQDRRTAPVGGSLMRLRKGLSLVRGMPRSLTEDEQHRIAGAIVEHLERSNWKVEQGPVREGHGPNLMSK